MTFDLLCIGEGMAELSCDDDPRFETTFAKTYAGDVLNTAVAASRLGSKVGFLTGLSDDPLGFEFRNFLLDEGLDITPSKFKKNSQIGLYFKAREIDGKPSFQYYRQGSAASLLNENDIHEKVIRSAKIVYTSGVTLALSKTCREAALKAFEIARAYNVMTAFDPNYRKKLWPKDGEAVDCYRQIMLLSDIILPTVPDDTRFLLGIVRPERVIDALWRRGAKLVAVKAGEKGCYLGYKEQVEHIPAMMIDSRKVMDLTGAGDAFNGGFLHGLARQMPLADCGKLGNATAGFKIQSPGTLTGLPGQEEAYAHCFPEPVSLNS